MLEFVLGKRRPARVIKPDADYEEAAVAFAIQWPSAILASA